MTEVYARDPLETVNGVPVYARRESEDYIANYDQIAADHLSSVNLGHGNPFMDEAVWREIEANTESLLRTHVAPGSRVLDVGVGTGRLLGRFPEFDRYGVDVSLGYLKRLVGGDIRACLANSEDLPYKDGVFDAVICTDVLEHVVDLNAAVREIDRVLKPGGRLIIRVPYREELWPYLAENFPYRLAHVRSFDEYSLEILFCRILTMNLLECRLDRALISSRLRLPLPRGAGVTTSLLRRLVKRVPVLNAHLIKLFRPIEITMMLEKPVA